LHPAYFSYTPDDMSTDNARDLVGLRLFVRVAESGSFSKAAQALDTTQPMISRRIAAVEKAWGGRGDPAHTVIIFQA
jgi:hypothetical protein